MKVAFQQNPKWDRAYLAYLCIWPKVMLFLQGLKYSLFLGAVIPSVKERKPEKVYYGKYILIGVAGLILLGLIAFIIYINLKEKDNWTDDNIWIDEKEIFI